MVSEGRTQNVLDFLFDDLVAPDRFGHLAQRTVSRLKEPANTKSTLVSFRH